MAVLGKKNGHNVHVIGILCPYNIPLGDLETKYRWGIKMVICYSLPNFIAFLSVPSGRWHHFPSGFRRYCSHVYLLGPGSAGENAKAIPILDPSLYLDFLSGSRRDGLCSALSWRASAGVSGHPFCWALTGPVPSQHSRSSGPEILKIISSVIFCLLFPFRFLDISSHSDIGLLYLSFFFPSIFGQLYAWF